MNYDPYFSPYFPNLIMIHFFYTNQKIPLKQFHHLPLQLAGSSTRSPRYTRKKLDTSFKSAVNWKSQQISKSWRKKKTSRNFVSHGPGKLFLVTKLHIVTSSQPNSSSLRTSRHVIPTPPSENLLKNTATELLED